MLRNKIKCLIVEDNPGDFILIKELLLLCNIRFEVIVPAENLNEAIKKLQKDHYDLILLDLFLPDSAGKSTFMTINQHASNIPIIVLSGLSDSETALDTVRHGAQDYLIKGDFDERILEKAIYYSIERKKNLDYIQVSEEKYRQLFESNPAPMMGYDIDSMKLEIVNKAAQNHYEYSEPELLSMNIKDIFDASEMERLSRLLLSKKKLKGEWVNRKKDGSIIYVDIISNDYYISNKLLRLLIIYDITEKVKAVEHAFFQAHILQSISDSVVLVNNDDKIEFWNEGAEKSYGYRNEEAIGKPIYMICPKGEEKDHQYIKNYLNDHGEFSGEVRRLTKSGEEVWMEVRAKRIKNSKNEVQGILKVSNDITERKRFEEQLLIQKKAIEAVGVGIILTNPQEEGSPIIYANPKYLEMSGYKEEEVIGNNWMMLFGEDTDKDTIKNISEALAKQKPFVGEMINYKKDGEPFWNFVAINPVFDSKGRLINYVIFEQDITEKKKAADELLEKNRELNNFIYRASHDLRGPLASLMGLSELAKMELKGKNASLYINLICQTSEKLDEILRKLLELTTLKQSEPQIEEVMFQKIVEDVVKGMEGYPEFENSKITYNFQNDSPIKTDKTILKFILHNLIENAVYFKNKNIKENKIGISYKSLPERKQIIISDNGMGIKEENLQKVFNMFYRGTEVSKGSGLGLYTVKSFVEKLHGNIAIDSKVNEGTQVTINLPEEF